VAGLGGVAFGFESSGRRALGGRAPDARAVPLPPSRPRSEPDSAAARGAITACPELDCVRGRLPPSVVAGVEARALKIGVGADRVLIDAGVMSEEDYIRALAQWLRLPFEALEHMPRALCPLSDAALLTAARIPILPVELGDGPARVVAPRGMAVRLLVKAARAHQSLPFVRLAVPCALNRFIARHGADALGRTATSGLDARYPMFSSAPRTTPRAIWIAPLLGLITLITALWPGVLFNVLALALTGLFIGWTVLRLRCLLAPVEPLKREASVLKDDALPLYTIIVALYREASSVRGLVGALKALDYPPEKVDVKFAVEFDDHETRAALESLALGPRFEIIVAPDFGPRTKPKALNAALAFARGDLTVIYDAEDRPEPDQLRRAAAMFAESDGNLACVQAALTIDNTRDSWLAALFTAEYAGHFDVLLPGLAAHDLLIPLGGTSNHFRTDMLRAVGGWDPYNVTEDADLGTRLARFGLKTTTLSSTTYEEAPAQLGPWLKQRTRWFKGWMRTSIVHMRQPLRFARDIGAASFLAFHLTLAGTVLAALVQPYLLFLFLRLLIEGTIVLPAEADGGMSVLVMTHAIAAISGYVTAAVLALEGLRRRGIRRTGWVLALMPVYWALLSVAAWRAVFQLLFKPHYWEKTPHGLARTSRRAQRGQR
jgi:cellulose synthase/poly-beta-1,6-N-acetylglucosamine synthase-like glycosyltransferase